MGLSSSQLFYHRLRLGHAESLGNYLLKGDAAGIEEEIGDLLLTVTSLCRKLHVDAEVAMNKATNKFIDRFEMVENATIAKGLDIEKTPMAELDAIWDEIKAQKSPKTL